MDRLIKNFFYRHGCRQRQIWDCCNIQDGALCDNSQWLSILDVAAVLDPSLMGNLLLVKCSQALSSWIKKGAHSDGFGTKFERNIKRVVWINQFTNLVWSYFGQLAIEYKMELGFILFPASETQNIKCVAHSLYCRV